ncbi:hypothetical protein J5X98_07960 [Leptothermofonsia sichuanensis E412]|uniref:hypothetical protein n=1 Tax=Leptothermofonsia sichuanensis TaxID=2917832 RepID=UPI001CA75BE4|nr:hypothetical protein [Leptothermofonsia sichuanensis]QZZ22306.1 hypothetical protein J5X98_07960 [Leptothermofonsia sichuanensis E412]
MKNLFYATTITLTCLSSVSVVFAGLSIRSTAFAAERACSSVLSPATTGGSIREHLEAIARCHSSGQSSSAGRSSFTQSKQMSPAEMNLIPGSSSNLEDIYPAYCSPLPGGVKPGDFAFREALARCKYGS